MWRYKYRHNPCLCWWLKLWFSKVLYDMLSIQTCTAALSLRLGSTTENFSPFSFPHKNLQSQTSCTPMLITLLNSAAAFSLIGWATPVVDQFIMEKDHTARSPRGQQATHIKTSPKVLPHFPRRPVQPWAVSGGRHLYGTGGHSQHPHICWRNIPATRDHSVCSQGCRSRQYLCFAHHSKAQV